MIHFHWPERLWRMRGEGFSGGAIGVVGLWRYLRLARRLGIRVIWTAHNLDHHEGSSWIDRRGYAILATNADLVICHSQATRAEIERRWRTKQTVVMPHGNYDGAYPEPRDRATVLEELGLSPALPTMCCVGQIREYKNFELAAEAVALLSRDVQLVIAGNVPRWRNVDHLRNMIANNPKSRLLEGMVPAQQFADIVAASDAMLLPYRKITGSGALLAAWTFGTGVIASDLPYFRECAAPEPLAAEFFENENAEALAAAIEKYLYVKNNQRREAVLRLSDRYSWQRCIEPVVESFRQWTTSG